MKRVRHPLGVAGGVVLLGAAVVATWWLFLGHEYSKNYSVAQVAGCGVVLILLAAVGGMLLPRWAVVIAIAVPFTVAWIRQVSSHDETGLSAVGALYLLAGLTVASLLVVLVVRQVTPVLRAQARRDH